MMQFPSQHVRVSGASGMVGQALVTSLHRVGCSTSTFVRRAAETAAGRVLWTPGQAPDPSVWDGVDAFVHLAGDNIAAGRWTSTKKQRIRSSRVEPTRALCESLARAKHPPRTLVCASAIGWYGDRGAEWLDESSHKGSGFLAEVCEAWESAAEPARDAGIRVVHMRLGLVLAKQGGALAKMLVPFRLGVGGRIGSGQQYWSWVALDDVVCAMEHALSEPNLQGPVNVTAPHPVTNAAFTLALGRALHRPTWIPLPAFAARLALGRQMADELLLQSARVCPRALENSGFAFRWPRLDTFLASQFA